MSELERLVDTLDNLASALELPMPDSIHVSVLRSKLPEVAAELRALAGAGGWRPMSEAPMDGSQFLIWTNRIGFAVVSHDVDDPMPTDIVPSGHHLKVDDGKFGPYSIRGDYPTHWQPLPTPPAVAG